MNENSEYRFLVGSLKMPPLHLAIVGHTNTGKTSLLRTLLRDSQFGASTSKTSPKSNSTTPPAWKTQAAY